MALKILNDMVENTDSEISRLETLVATTIHIVMHCMPWPCSLHDKLSSTPAWDKHSLEGVVGLTSIDSCFCA